MVESSSEATKYLTRCPPGMGNKRPKCCSYGLFQRRQNQAPGSPIEELHIPLKKVEATATLEGVMATTDMCLTYNNTMNVPIECTYEFPIDKSTTVAKLLIHLEGQTITAAVETKPDAKQIYAEAIKAQNTAVLAERISEDKEIMSIKVGQLQGGAQCVLEIQLLHVLEIENGAYAYKLPFGIYPEFERHQDGKPKAYEFSFKGTITSNRRIGYVSAPKDTQVQRNQAETQVNLTVSNPGRELKIFYRVDEMKKPTLFCTQNENFPGESVC